jgi:iron complex outermembrane receptor protein
VDYQASTQLKLSASANAQGNYYLERTNTLGRTSGYALLHLGATWRLSPTLDVGVQLKNVTNRKYVYAWYDSGSSGYSPGDGRSAYASLNWKF